MCDIMLIHPKYIRSNSGLHAVTGFVWIAGSESKECQGMYKLISAPFVLLT